MKKITDQLYQKLKNRAEDGTLRRLQAENHLVDFCSNDYLSFSRSQELKDIVAAEIQSHRSYYSGSTGSRLISGNTQYAEDLEQYIASFHDAESALLFNSGYDANVGLFSSIAQRGDTIISDELIHASIIDGIRLSHANRFTFKHNDLMSLESKLNAATGNIFIVVESVYSMDGDHAPLAEINKLAGQYGAALIVDEAHAAGIFGELGKGIVYDKNLQISVFARIITYGKAFGVHGATVLGSEILRSYLINFSRSFIYTTAQSFHSLACIKSAYLFLEKYNHQEHIFRKIGLFNKLMNINHEDHISPIKRIVIEGNEKAKQASFSLKNKGFDVRAILSPTVAPGTERLRICLHNHNSDEEITKLAVEIKRLF